MGRLIDTGLGSSSLHMSCTLLPPHENRFVIGPAVIKTHEPKIPICREAKYRLFNVKVTGLAPVTLKI